MDIDIRKDNPKIAKAALRIERTSQQNSSATPTTPSELSAPRVYNEPEDREEFDHGDEEENLQEVARPENVSLILGIPASDLEASRKEREAHKDQAVEPEPSHVNGNGHAADKKGIFPLTAQNLDKANASEIQAGPNGVTLEPGRIEYTSAFRAPANKRISVPVSDQCHCETLRSEVIEKVRVEPKVFFALERTTLVSCTFGTSSDQAC
jgi:hypothetical protein